MLPIFHSAAAVALKERYPRFEIGPGFVAGCIAPDLYVTAPSVFSFAETHDITRIEPALLRLRDRSFALGFATHSFVFDPISHGFSTLPGYEAMRRGETAVLKNSYSFGWVAKRFPRLVLHVKAYEWAHVVPESFLETWIIKTRPDVLAMSKMLYGADTDAIADDLAQAFGRPREKVGKAVAIGMQYARQISRFHRLLAPFASDDSEGSRQKCLEQCLAACRTFSGSDLAKRLMG